MDRSAEGRFIACGRAKGQQFCEHFRSQPVALKRAADFSIIF